MEIQVDKTIPLNLIRQSKKRLGDKMILYMISHVELPLLKKLLGDENSVEPTLNFKREHVEILRLQSVQTEFQHLNTSTCVRMYKPGTQVSGRKQVIHTGKSQIIQRHKV